MKNYNDATFIKLIRSEEVFDLIAHHKEFILLTQIALRARRQNSKIKGIKEGQALIGDHKNIGLSEQSYRSAKSNIQKWGYATFKATNKGTVATLTGQGVYNINITNPNGLTNTQPTDKATDDPTDDPTTNKKVKKEKNKKEYKEKSEWFNNLPQNLQQDVFISVFSDWLKYKEERKDIYTEMGLKKIISYLSNKTKQFNLDLVTETINYSISQGWKGITFLEPKKQFPLKPSKELDWMLTPEEIEEERKAGNNEI